TKKTAPMTRKIRPQTTPATRNFTLGAKTCSGAPNRSRNSEGSAGGVGRKRMDGFSGGDERDFLHRRFVAEVDRMLAAFDHNADFRHHVSGRLVSVLDGGEKLPGAFELLQFDFDGGGIANGELSLSVRKQLLRQRNWTRSPPFTKRCLLES